MASPPVDHAQRIAEAGLNFTQSGCTFARLHITHAGKGKGLFASAYGRFLRSGGGWIDLRGSVGAGKTFCCCAAINDATSRGMSGLYLRLPAFVYHISAALTPNAPEVVTIPLYLHALGCRVLVLDDVDKVGEVAPAVLDRLTALLVARWRRRPAVTVWSSRAPRLMGVGTQLGRPDLDRLFARQRRFIQVDLDAIRPAADRHAYSSPSRPSLAQARLDCCRPAVSRRP